MNTVDEFRTSLGDEGESRENSSAHMALPGAIAYDIPMRKREHAWRAHPHHSAGAHVGAHSGDGPVSAKYAFGSRRGPSMRARMEGAGNVSGSGGNRSRESGIGTEYVRHTDAGAVRVVELPPLYNELQR